MSIKSKWSKVAFKAIISLIFCLNKAPNVLELGSPRYMCSIAPLSPLSLDRAVLHELWQRFSQLCTLSRRGSAPLSLLFLWTGQSCLRVLQCPSSPALSPEGGAQLACIPVVLQALPCCTCWNYLWVKGPLVCLLQHPPVFAGSSSRKGGWGCATVPCRLAREYGWSSHLLSTFKGNVSNSTHHFLQPWFVPSAPQEP